MGNLLLQHDHLVDSGLVAPLLVMLDLVLDQLELLYQFLVLLSFFDILVCHRDLVGMSTCSLLVDRLGLEAVDLPLVLDVLNLGLLLLLNHHVQVPNAARKLVFYLRVRD